MGALKPLADKYYGAAAETYDAARCHSLRWAKEQIAVEDFVFSGPVLDVPLGTGRFCSIYRAKGLDVIGVDVSDDMLSVARRNYPGIDARKGSVLDLPFPDETFGTVVCTRLLDWLPPADMRKAVAELRRMANILVLTIRHGEPECRVNYTHDLSEFYAAIDGLYIEQRRVTEITRDGTEEIFRIRKPLWADVVRQFAYPDRLFASPEDDIQRIACEATGYHVDIDRGSLSAEYWHPDQLISVIDAMAEVNRAYRTDHLPRFEGGPITLLRSRDRVVVLDGRRRINRLRGTSTLVPVLILEGLPAPSPSSDTARA